MTWRLNRLLLIAALLIGLPYYWLLIDNRPGDAAPKPVTIAQLRQLAAAIPGQHPSRVESELVAWRRLPGNLFAAGSGLKRVSIGIMAWQLPVEGAGPVVIDSGITAKDAADMGLEIFLPEHQARVEAAIDAAGLVLITHEHPDHLGALAARGTAGLGDALRLNAAQMRPAPLAAMLNWRETASPPARITPGAPQAVAPGVVVIPAPSHTPGSQLIFVSLADGREVLFAGDIATLGRSWQELRARSRLVGDYLAPEDRKEVYSWLRTIARLKREAPGLVVLPGHDAEWVFNERNKTGVIQGFSTAAAAPQRSN